MPVRSLRLLVLALAFVAGAVACGKKRLDQPPAAASTSAAVPEVLPERVEAVKVADDLALAGARAGGVQGAALTRDAARLRQRLWRLERREADALEAIELYRGAARSDPSFACDATLEEALLRSELEQDPGAAYAGAYLARARTKAGPCAKRAEVVMTTLAAYRPLPTVLADLDQQANGARKLPPDKGQARRDGDETVVLPKVDGAAKTGPVRVTGVERYGSEDAARIVVHMTRPAGFDVGFLPRQGETAPRLFIDIKGAEYKGALKYEVGGLVRRVRLGKRSDGTRLVLDLERAAFRKVFYLPEPFRLVVDLATTPPQPEEGPKATGPREVKRIVLDPGHGGNDSGATGPAGLREKDVTLDIAHRAAPILARELGISTLLTRDSDDYVALDERTARANAFKADLFVSIHCNATEAGDTRGVMTFVLDESRDGLATQTAALENAASAAAADELASALSQVLDQGSVARSVHFAELLQRSAVASIGSHYPGVPDLGVRRAGFYVLAGAHMPAVLFEVSFISDPTDEMRLNTGDYRQKVADAIVNAVRAYKEGL